MGRAGASRRKPNRLVLVAIWGSSVFSVAMWSTLTLTAPDARLGAKVWVTLLAGLWSVHPVVWAFRLHRMGALVLLVLGNALWLLATWALEQLNLQSLPIIVLAIAANLAAVLAALAYRARVFRAEVGRAPTRADEKLLVMVHDPALALRRRISRRQRKNDAAARLGALRGKLDIEDVSAESMRLDRERQERLDRMWQDGE